MTEGKEAPSQSLRRLPSDRKLSAAIDQFPELGDLLQHFVLGHGELGAEEKILEGVFVEDAMDDESGVVALEINAVFLRAIAVEIATLALEFAEFLGVGLVEILRQKIEFAEDLELECFGELGELGGAAVVEDDLEHDVF
jgi:hypothetical protein